MIIGIGKFGKSVIFNSANWGAAGGANEAPTLFEHLIRNNPQHTFVLIGTNDFKTLSSSDKSRINEHGNLIDPWSYKKEWKQTINPDNVLKNGINQYYMEQYIIPKYKVDVGVFFMGPCGTSNVLGKTCLRTNRKKLASPLQFTCLMAGPQIHYLNHYRDLPWTMILNDPRHYPNNIRDLMNPPLKILSQYERICANVAPLEYGGETDVITEIKQEYKRVETVFLMGKKRGEAIQECGNTLDSFFSDAKPVSTERDINFMIVCNEGLPSRYPDLKKYILDHVENIDIYGKWNPETIAGDKRFKGPKKFNELQSLLPRVKYTFCIPIRKGWVTAKFWEMAHYGIIPFLHPTYDEQGHLEVPDFIRVKDSKDLFEKIQFLEENPKEYTKLREQLDAMLKDEYYDGSYMNNLIMDTINEITQVAV